MAETTTVIFMLVITSFTTIGNGISSYTVQNLGAGKLDRVRAGFKEGVKLIWILCVSIILLYCLAPVTLIHMFIDAPTQTAIDTGVIFLRILSPFYLVISVKLIADGILRGASQMRQFIIATFTDLILRVVLAIILADSVLGSIGIWVAWPVGWSIATAVSIIFYKNMYKKLI